MKVDDVEIKVGVNLWDAFHGFGTVAKINRDTFDMSFQKSGRTITYSDGGLMSGVKLLFSDSPFVIAPTPEQKAMVIKLLDAVSVKHNGKGA